MATAQARELPLAFEANVGQTAAPVDFVARGSGYAAGLRADRMLLSLGSRPEGGRALNIRLAGARRDARPTTVGRPVGRVNLLHGNRPERWRTGIPLHRKVGFDRVYPGVDVVYYGRGGQLEYDFVLAPRARARRIALAFDGADRLRLDERGDLLIALGTTEVRQRAPVAYQRVRGRRRPVAARYVLRGAGRVGFALGRYDRSRPLVIDPVIAWSTFLGGSAADAVTDVEVAPDGHVFVAGRTRSPDFPAAAGFDSTCGLDGTCDDVFYRDAAPYGEGASDAFVAKLDPTGSRLVYATYLGGAGREGASLAVDGSGTPYLAGPTGSLDFPTTPGAYARTPPASPGCTERYDRDCDNAYVAKLAPDGASLTWATYLGGATWDGLSGIALGADGSAFVAGATSSTDFPRTPGTPPPPTGFSNYEDVFLAKLRPDGGALTYSMRFGGLEDEYVGGVDVDAAGNAYVAGTTSSSEFPVTAGALKTGCAETECDHEEGFVTKVSASGAAFAWSTRLGGTRGYDQVRAIDVSAAGDPYVTGSAGSSDFPTTDGALDRTRDGGAAFVARLARTGSALAWSTFVDGSDEDDAYAVAEAPDGGAYVGGGTRSLDFPAVSAPQRHASGCGMTGGGCDGFVAHVAPGGGSLRFSTYLGGLDDEAVLDVAPDRAGGVVAGGVTYSPDFPVRAAYDGAYANGTCDQAPWSCGDDGFVTALSGSGVSAAYDDLANARYVKRDTGESRTSTEGATLEPGEPQHAGRPGGASVWFRWTAPATRQVTIDTSGSSFDTLLAVYAGGSYGSLTAIAADDDAGGGGASRVTFRATRGRTYRIAVDGDGGARGDVRLAWRTARPANDDFAAAQPLSGSSGSAAGDTTAGTLQAGEPFAYGTSSTVWYRWTAPADGGYRFSSGARGAGVTAYTGSSLDALAYADLTYARAGTTYHLRVDTEGGWHGPFRLTWAHHARPANDAFANAAAIGGATGSMTVDATAATREPGEPSVGYYNRGHSIWFRWTAPADGVYEFDLEGTRFDALLQAFDGDSLSSLRPMRGGSRIPVGAQAGDQYILLIDVTYGGASTAVLSWRPAPKTVPNDLFGSAETLTGSQGTTRGRLEVATTQPGEPLHGGSRATGLTAWYAWTAPASGPVTIELEDYAETFTFAIYRGDSVTALTELASSTHGDGHCCNRRRLTFDAVAGTRYRIVVGDGFLVDEMPFALSWNQGRPVNDDFANATPVPAGGAIMQGDSVFAGKEPGEPEFGAWSVWWKWTPSTSHTATISKRGSYGNESIEVFTGSSLGSLTRVAGTESPNHETTFSARAGTTYRIRMQGPADGGGDLVLSVNQVATDTTPPQVTLVQPEDGLRVRDRVAAEVELVERGGSGMARVEWRAGTTIVATTYGSEEEAELDLSGLGEGPVSITARAIDNAGLHTTSSPRSIVIDRTAPQTRLDSAPSGTVRSRTVTIAFSAEPGAEYKCHLDAATWFDCASPMTLEGLADGPHAFGVRAVDTAANWDMTPARATWTVDGPEPATPETVAPETTITSAPDATTNDTTPTFEFVADESDATFECRVDGAPFTPCASPHTSAPLADGAHVFEVRAVDAAGNLDPTPARHAFTVDTRAPGTGVSGGPPPAAPPAALPADQRLAPAPPSAPRPPSGPRALARVPTLTLARGVGAPTARLSRRGVLTIPRLRAACPAGRLACTLRVDVRLRGRRAGAARQRVPAGTATPVRLRLGRATRAAIRRAGPRAAVRITATLRHGERAARRSLTVRLVTNG